MSLILKAVEKGKHLCGDRELETQTWKQFQEISIGKQIFIFGVGNALDYFFRNCCNYMKITGVIDNNKKIQGQKLGWHCAEAWQTEYENIIVQSPDILKKFSCQDVVVLITSINYYQPMIEQLKNIGVYNCFSMLMMETNAKKVAKKKCEDMTKIRTAYVEYCCKYQIVDNKIVMSYGEYGGHARQITRQLLQTEEKLDIVWLVNEISVEAPKGVRLVPKKNWKWYTFEMQTAKMWLFDVTVPDFIVKRQEQIYIQVKHWSSITLKKFYLDDKSSCASEEIATWIKKDGERMDYLLSGSEFDEVSCRSGLAFKGKAIRVGSARSDVLFEKGIKEKVYTHFRLDLNTHILLYAPTYRHREFIEGHRMSVSLNIKKLLDAITAKFGGEWYIFVRLHPWLNFEQCGMKETERIINAGNYQDSEELVAAADIMVTDFSSIMFEAAFARKPVFLYAPDKKEYIEKERGLLLDYEQLPFSIAESNEELVQCIVDFDWKKYKKDVMKFLNRYGVHEDGHASERAANFILGLLEND